MKHPTLLNSYILFFLLLFGSNLFSQELLIYSDSKNYSSLTVEEKRQYAVYENSQFYENLTIAKWEKIDSKQENGIIKINLPDDDCEDLYFKVTEVEYKDDGNYSWTGDLEPRHGNEDCYCRYGTITLVSSPHGKIAHLQIDNKVFEILELSPETHIIAKLNEAKFTDEECAATSTSNSSSIKTEQNTTPRNIGNCDVRCLVLFTPNAIAFEGSLAAVNNRVNLAIRQTNRALRKSAVSSCELNIELAGVLPINLTETTAIIDHTSMNTNNQIAAMRDDAEADIVVLLTDGDYGSIYGVANIGPSEEIPYALVQAGAATTGRFTFAHEVGHLFGARHEESNNSEGTIEHGHSFNTGSFLPCLFGHNHRTILHTLGAKGVRIQHYSNPNVYFDNEKTGKNNIRENANQLRNTACTVATFRESIEPFGVAITGNDCYCPCQSTSKFAEVFNGTAGATYTFSWETSLDGFTWTTSTTYSGTSIAHAMPCNAGESLFFRVTVTSSTGMSATSAVASVLASSNCPDQQFPCIEQIVNHSNTNAAITLSPNPSPSYQESNFTIQINDNANYTIFIYDIKGGKRSILVENQYFSKGVRSIKVPPLDKGVYILDVIQDNEHYSSTKMLKI